MLLGVVRRDITAGKTLATEITDRARQDCYISLAKRTARGHTRAWTGISLLSSTGLELIYHRFSHAFTKAFWRSKRLY